MSTDLTDFLEGFDFSLLNDPDFKEDSVREELILPILKALGYKAAGENKLIRSKKLIHPFVSTGSGSRPITNYPDYSLQVSGEYKWILDAKGPDEDILSGKNVEQAYFYAIHPEVRVEYYALCNGKEFALYGISDQTPILHFPIEQIGKYWSDLNSYLSPDAFVEKSIGVPTPLTKDDDFEYSRLTPLNEIKGISKQSAKRHFGVHGYFTKQAWQVVSRYIENFTRPGDVVLDPFGGTGVTLIEALIKGRKAIHIDINPLSIFIVESLLLPTDLALVYEEFQKIRERFERHCPRTGPEIETALKKYWFPSGITLMKNADVETIEELFSPIQLAQLAYLRHLIIGVKDTAVRQTLLLMFSGLLNKINLTYHASGNRSAGRGDSAMFRYYRFRIAPTPATLDVMTYFESRLNKVVAAKQELSRVISGSALASGQILKGSATELEQIKDESIDYIYTDPPYGSKIPYLDLSVLWNAWLGLNVTKEDYRLEAIEGGELKKSKDDYSSLISQSIKEMFRVLKFDRWMSFVFQHQDPAYWHLIVETAERVGFEYAGAVRQSNGQSSFKKRQNPFTVLSGQLIINFKKVRNPKSIMKAKLGGDITELVHQAIEDIIAHHGGASIEEINNEIVIKFMELNILDLVARKYKDLSEFLAANFDFDDETKKYNLRKETKFRANIPVEVRIKYYLISMMRRLAREGVYPHIDDIYLEIMPLLKNGTTPEKQTILNVLETIAVRTGEDQWMLNESEQRNLFSEI